MLAAGHVLAAEEAELLLSAILVDTVNLDASKGRCEACDVDMVARLRAICSTADIFEQTIAAKFDISSLTCAELLRKVLIACQSDDMAYCDVTSGLQADRCRPNSARGAGHRSSPRDLLQQGRAFADIC